MIIDVHTHIFPKEMRDNREKYFQDDPEFKLLYNSPIAKMASARDLVSTMEKHKVDLSFICGFPWKNPEYAKKNNDYVINSVIKYPDRLKGFACFDANWDQAADETQRCIKAGLSGVGELAFYLNGIDDSIIKKLEPVMQVLKSNNNLPLLIHTNESVGYKYPGKAPMTIDQIYKLAKTFMENKIILAHWGGGIFFYNLLKKEAKEVFKNIWFDTAASPFLYDTNIYKTALHTGVIDKILFGTDFPLLNPDRYYKEIKESGISKHDQDKILGKNAALLLNIV